MLVGVLALALSLTMGLAATGGAAAKKKKGGAKTAFAIGSVGAVPDGPTSSSVNAATFLGTATVGKKFKGKTVGDVDATLSLSGISAPGTTCGGLCDINVRLTAPNGAQTGLVAGGSGTFGVTGNLVTNLTLSDQTPTRTCGGAGTPGFPATPPPPPCGDPDATLLAPFTGTAQPTGFLNLLNGSPVRGTWTLTTFDFCGVPACGNAGTSAIAAWSLKITPARAPR